MTQTGKGGGRIMRKVILIAVVLAVTVTMGLTSLLAGCYDSTKKEGNLEKRASLTVRE